MSIVYELPARRRPRIAEHLKKLPTEDRFLRFGGPTSDEAIDRYVESIDFERDVVFGIYGEARGELIAVTHVAQMNGAAELGLSVLPEHRARGLAQAMFRRAEIHARNRSVDELYMHCLAQNGAMMHIARKSGMRIVIDGPERDAWLELPPPSALSFGAELQCGQLVLLDRALRSTVKGFDVAGRAARAALEAVTN